jgi:hypothetical protein
MGIEKKRMEKKTEKRTPWLSGPKSSTVAHLHSFLSLAAHFPPFPFFSFFPFSRISLTARSHSPREDFFLNRTAVLSGDSELAHAPTEIEAEIRGILPTRARLPFA